jgi:two-component system, NtrC family, response regulator HydG
VTRRAQDGATPLERSLDSPLRLRLLTELLQERTALTVEEFAVRVACPAQDVIACLRPMIALGVLETTDDGTRWALRGDLPEEARATIQRVIAARSAELARDQRMRHELLAGLVGADPKMQLVAEMVRKVAKLDVPVLITGETGTGKELVARAIHDLSRRGGAFFGDVNCATLTETLFESHVFGHARGAFTGAVREHVGLVERCDGGSLFLDEIGELSAGNQVKLLKVLQSKTFTRVGETSERRSDFRLVSATNRHLPAMITGGAFREDLYYRINVFPIVLPALRERLDDLPYLIDELVARNAAKVGRVPAAPVVSQAALERMRRYPWPGNIRELENVVVRALIAAGGEPIDVRHLPPLEASADARPKAALRTMGEVERDHLAHVLAAVDGNISAAAQTLGMARATVYRKLREHGIDITRTTRLGGRDG